ncbi:MAG: hypothetical protein UW07_C0023G0004 [Candidatus Nomurabacteria bacterium GW2011_GWF2_43_8]|uniref:VanZ-like domain-containing protein n=3 Tax=Candidatus Nomuraibacteriota TaxID=1752729 RepID=A0A0G1FM09_9BACT|nr:MAG: hypothetical protein UV76_C0002G0084 [Candidatus Nomurabacteria bacterium GW2011_GWA2_43_15]KKT19873.1 MAG: hypothetical protein UW02_C0004G0050 [Candidatus Nomurabacteria bacterium GW2011_GWB1_43_7]KKT23456.1 MAG: hypothetical protein UW07_C0023G0004 [Candidatus Nomurabacteria bacterium GW2011_GWF2_43_8]
MDRKKLFKTLALVIILIFFADFAAHKLHWYSSIWYFDMLMHFLGGFWAGLVLIWLLPARSRFFVYKILFGILLVGILWEIFQILVNSAIAQNPFDALDSTSDIFFDLAGGALAVLYFSKKIMLSGSNEVE